MAKKKARKTARKTAKRSKVSKKSCKRSCGKARRSKKATARKQSLADLIDIVLDGLRRQWRPLRHNGYRAGLDLLDFFLLTSKMS